MNLLIIILLTTFVILFLDYYEKIPVFYARKLTHMVCGIMILIFDHTLRNENQIDLSYDNSIIQKDPRVIYIYVIACISILKCIFYPFRFSTYYDKGVIIYNVIIIFFFLFKFPLYILTPMFFADPMAAIVGQAFSSKTIYKKKTILGTITAFIVSFLCLYFVKNMVHRLSLSFVLCLLELFGGQYDNLCLCIPLFLYMFLVEI